MLNVLAQVEIFNGLCDEELEVLAASSVTRQYPKNTVIINEGDHADSLYLIDQGRVKVYCSDKNGKEFMAEMTTQPIPLRQDTAGFAVFVRDITQRKRAEEAQRRAKEEALAPQDFVDRMAAPFRWFQECHPCLHRSIFPLNLTYINLRIN